MLKQVSSHKKTIMLILFVSVLATSGFDYAHAQTTAGTTLTSSGIAIAVFIAAGVLWSLSGYINNIRNHANYDRAHPTGPADPDWKGFDPKAMKDDVFIGLILGVVAFVLNGTNTLPLINTVPAFLGAMISAYGLIGLTDKIGVGAILNR